MVKYIKQAYNKADRAKSHTANFRAADHVKQSWSELYKDGRIAENCFVAPATLFCWTNTIPLFTINRNSKPSYDVLKVN